MQRFFCTICQRVKRVRQLPYATLSGEDGNYSGECRWHAYVNGEGQKPHAAFLGRDGIPATPKFKPNPKPPAFPQKSRGKRVMNYTA